MGMDICMYSFVVVIMWMTSKDEHEKKLSASWRDHTNFQGFSLLK